VAHAAVVAREDESGDKRLVAYVVAAAGSSVCGAGAAAADGEREAGPEALPAPEWTSREYVAPEGETERLIAAIFEEVLKLERVGREDNFFELGGHSLLAMRVLSQLRERLQVELPLRALFEQPTVKGLADQVFNEAKQPLRAQQDFSLDPVLPLRQKGHLRALFCVHSASGIAWSYSKIVPYLPAGHPVYGLQARDYYEPASSLFYSRSIGERLPFTYPGDPTERTLSTSGVVLWWYGRF
jgi:acyl carrier protein